MSYRILYHHRIRADDGQAVHVRELIGALRASGHEVLESALVPKAEATSRNGTPSALGRVLRRVRLPRALVELLEIGYGSTAHGRLLAAARRHDFRPDFVYERHALHCAAGLAAARRLGVPLLLEVNSPMVDEMERLGALRFSRRARRTERRVLGEADCVLAVSEVLRDWLIEAGARPERTVVVRNGAEPSRYGDEVCRAGRELRARHAAAGAFVIGFVGYARPWHRLDLVLEALAAPDLAHAELWVVGDGPARPELERRGRDLGIASRLRWLGAVSAGELPPVVSAFDCAVIPAINPYASPLKLFDYLAAGVPAVVPDQANLRELVADREHAMLFRPGDGGAMVARLRELAAAPDQAAALGAAGRRRLLERDWTWVGAARRVVSAFEQLGAEAGR